MSTPFPLQYSFKKEARGFNLGFSFSLAPLCSVIIVNAQICQRSTGVGHTEQKDIKQPQRATYKIQWRLRSKDVRIKILFLTKNIRNSFADLSPGLIHRGTKVHNSKTIM